MIQMQTILKVMDNTGARFARCIKVLKKGTNCKYGKIGDTILVSVTKLRRKNRQFSKVRKGETHLAVIVKTRKVLKRKTGYKLFFFYNCVVLLGKDRQPFATRVFGGVIKELRSKKLSKVITLSSGIV